MLKKFLSTGDDVLNCFRKAGVSRLNALETRKPGRGKCTFGDVISKSQAGSFANACEVEGQVGDRFTLGQDFTGFAVKLGEAVCQWLRKLRGDAAEEVCELGAKDVLQ